MTRADDSDRGPRTIEVSARVHDHLQAMGTPDESANDTLERLLGLTPDPATVAGDELSTPLPDDPVVPDALATDPTTDATAVDPEDVPAVEVAPADVDDALGELAAILDVDDREATEALLDEIDNADPDELADILAALDTDEPDTDEPDTDEPDTDEPDTDEPDTDEPDTDEPDTDEPDTDEPDTDKTDDG
jgi:hypothetical protein